MIRRGKSIVERGEATLARRMEKIEEAKKRRKIEGDTTRYATNARLDVTGWDEHLKGFDWEQLMQMIRSAVVKEPERQPHGFEEN
ncbi:hypothetical protein LTR28_005201, partial [Elasticomyces elasticus]